MILVVFGLLTIGGKFEVLGARGGHCAKCAPAGSHAGH
jgi:hypothetical protein